MTETVEFAESMAASATEETASRAAFGALLGDLLPRQGCWSDEGYLWLTDHSRRPVEFTDGVVEELPMPTDTHQAILSFLNDLFRIWLRPRGGVVSSRACGCASVKASSASPISCCCATDRIPVARTGTGWARTW